ncbi:MAG: carboxypeptidase regulatory-like domain-containing protein [Acidobacteria bacterium]|nr:carboxypeptidase regulatory-like domain-containing protein [Acidobacteriota bacterium]
MRHRTFWILVSLAAIAVAGACNSRSDVPPVSIVPEGGGAAANAVGATGTSTVTGSITFEGEPPAPETIRMNSDPVCVKEATNTETEYYVVGDGGGLGNVFVYVKEGLSGSYSASGETIVLDQQGCRYTPHVFGVQVGQTVQITNSDPTLHNIHATPAVNAEFNTGQPIQGMSMERTFDQVEVALDGSPMVPFKCDVHGWMNAYVGVLDHPYFVTTSPDGGFDIGNLPAGNYVIAAWHEMLGEQTQNVTVGDGATANVSFTFTAG